MRSTRCPAIWCKTLARMALSIFAWASTASLKAPMSPPTRLAPYLRTYLSWGFATSEDYSAAPGYIRAYHMPSGQLRWTFKTIPGAGEYGVDTWPEANRDKRGGANAWAGLTVDEERGIVFVPTGSAGYDFYGGQPRRRQSVRQQLNRAGCAHR